MVDLEGMLKTKTEGDMTMKEVIERVRKELNDQYVPLVNKFREEASAKDTFYRRELEKQELALV